MKPMDLSEIKHLRDKLRITQSELAKRAGVSQALIARIENKSVDPRYSKVVAIFGALKELKKGGGKEIIAKDVMRRGVAGVEKNEILKNVTITMRKRRISQMPVFDKEVIVGSISEKTIVERMVKGEDLSALSAKRAGEIMNPPFPSVNKETPIMVISALLEHSPAVVVMDEGLAAGIITKADLLKFVHG